MGSLPDLLAAELREALNLERAVETGTYLGDGARVLAELFATVVTIELSEHLYALATHALSNCANVRTVQGDSRVELPRIVNDNTPTLYFLDGHWSAGNTAGEGSECPVLDEIAAIAEGHADDCIIIDDARLFTAPPPPPHDPQQWPSLMQVWDLIRSSRPTHYVTLFEDQVVAVPERAKYVVDRHATRALARASC